MKRHIQGETNRLSWLDGGSFSQRFSRVATSVSLSVGTQRRIIRRARINRENRSKFGWAQMRKKSKITSYFRESLNRDFTFIAMEKEIHRGDLYLWQQFYSLLVAGIERWASLDASRFIDRVVDY